MEVEVEVVGGSEEASASPLVAHPCSLLQLLLRACAGCLGLRGYCSDDDDPKPAAATGTDDVDAPGAVAAAAKSPQEGDRQGDGDKAASEVVTQVWAVTRRPPPPGRPREGSGGNGGNHH
ncbi:unnamed protein product [Miscanthus lutarioriparius]|uniref:Uncharacterized protein n=1 Tax=Miscanthus lutarioriparius TaxID=422564 RepID=A0A811QTD3_9POAL|nr:unnamed protein product [Miscanthus lutarioriparius]